MLKNTVRRYIKIRTYRIYLQSIFDGFDFFDFCQLIICCNEDKTLSIIPDIYLKAVYDVGKTCVGGYDFIRMKCGYLIENKKEIDNLHALNSLAKEPPDTTRLTSMQGMFAAAVCSKDPILTLDVRLVKNINYFYVKGGYIKYFFKWNVSNVVSLGAFFSTDICVMYLDNLKIIRKNMLYMFVGSSVYEAVISK